MNDLLMKGEKIVWEGRTKAFNLTDAPYKANLIIRWIIWAVVAIGLSVGFYVYAAVDPVVEFLPALLIFTIGVPLFFGLQPVFDRKTIQKHGSYAITNLRVISYTGDRRLWSMPLEDAKKFRIDRLGNGTAAVLIGEASKARATAARTITLMGIQAEDNTKTVGLAFYGIEDYETVRRILANGIDK